MMFLHFNEEDKKRRELEQKVASGTKDVADYGALGQILSEKGEHNKLIPLYKDALQLEATDFDKADICHELGVALYKLKVKHEAQLYFEKSLSLLSDYEGSSEVLELMGLSYYYLYWLYADKEKRENACYKSIKLFEKIVAKYPEFEGIVDVRSTMSNLYRELEDHDKAVDCCLATLTLAKSEKEKLESYLCVANAFKFKGDHENAKKYYRKALSVAKVDKTLLSEIHHGMGSLFEDLGDKNGAEVCYEKALKELKFKPETPTTTDFFVELGFRLGVLATERRDFKKAIKHFTACLKKIDSQHKDFWNIQLWLAGCYCELKRYDMAKMAYEAVLACKDTPREEIIKATFYLASAHMQLDDYPKAIENYEQLMNISPEHRVDPFVLYDLGIAYTRVDKKAKAIQILEKVITKELPSEDREEILNMLTVLYLSLEQHEQANKYLGLLNEEFPNSPLAKEATKAFRKYSGHHS